MLPKRLKQRRVFLLHPLNFTADAAFNALRGHPARGRDFPVHLFYQCMGRFCAHHRLHGVLQIKVPAVIGHQRQPVQQAANPWQRSLRFFAADQLCPLKQFFERIGLGNAVIRSQ